MLLYASLRAPHMYDELARIGFLVSLTLRAGPWRTFFSLPER